MKSYIDSIMKNKKRGYLHSCVSVILKWISVFYGLVIRSWNALYSSGILKAYSVPLKVISVGNLTVGGTGKTPMTLFLAERIARRGKRFVVITRGYGNDEWALLERSLGKDNVLKGRDRVRLAGFAYNKLSKEVAILDDGYQHRRLARDLNILLIDASNPFGNGSLLPGGILREPVSAIARADVVCITKADLGGQGKSELKNMITQKYGKPVCEAVYRVTGLRDIRSREETAIEGFTGEPVIALSAIADAGYFRHTLRKHLLDVKKEIEFLDHHEYSSGEMSNICAEANREGVNSVIVTEKDGVKIKRLDFEDFGVNIYELVVKLDMPGLTEEKISEFFRFDVLLGG